MLRKKKTGTVIESSETRENYKKAFDLWFEALENLNWFERKRALGVRTHLIAHLNDSPFETVKHAVPLLNERLSVLSKKPDIINTQKKIILINSQILSFGEYMYFPDKIDILQQLESSVFQLMETVSKNLEGSVYDVSLNTNEWIILVQNLSECFESFLKYMELQLNNIAFSKVKLPTPDIKSRAALQRIYEDQDKIIKKAIQILAFFGNAFIALGDYPNAQLTEQCLKKFKSYELEESQVALEKKLLEFDFGGERSSYYISIKRLTGLISKMEMECNADIYPNLDLKADLSSISIAFESESQDLKNLLHKIINLAYYLAHKKIIIEEKDEFWTIFKNVYGVLSKKDNPSWHERIILTLLKQVSTKIIELSLKQNKPDYCSDVAREKAAMKTGLHDLGIWGSYFTEWFDIAKMTGERNKQKALEVFVKRYKGILEHNLPCFHQKVILTTIDKLRQLNEARTQSDYQQWVCVFGFVFIDYFSSPSSGFSFNFKKNPRTVNTVIKGFYDFLKYIHHQVIAIEQDQAELRIHALLPFDWVSFLSELDVFSKIVLEVIKFRFNMVEWAVKCKNQLDEHYQKDADVIEVMLIDIESTLKNEIDWISSFIRMLYYTGKRTAAKQLQENLFIALMSVSVLSENVSKLTEVIIDNNNDLKLLSKATSDSSSIYVDYLLKVYENYRDSYLGPLPNIEIEEGSKGRKCEFVQFLQTVPTVLSGVKISAEHNKKFKELIQFWISQISDMAIGTIEGRCIVQLLEAIKRLYETKAESILSELSEPTLTSDAPKSENEAKINKKKKKKKKANASTDTSSEKAILAKARAEESRQAKENRRLASSQYIGIDDLVSNPNDESSSSEEEGTEMRETVSHSNGPRTNAKKPKLTRAEREKLSTKEKKTTSDRGNSEHYIPSTPVDRTFNQTTIPKPKIKTHSTLDELCKKVETLSVQALHTDPLCVDAWCKLDVPRIPIPEHVSAILKTAHNKGYRALLTGGAVPDLIHGNAPRDYDFILDCTEAELVDIVKAPVVKTPIKVMDVFKLGDLYEFALKPKGFSLLEDAKSRDFATWYANYLGEIYAPLFDYDKIFEKRIKCKLEDDPVRILRAIDKKTKYDKEFHPDLEDAIRRSLSHLSKIPFGVVKSQLCKHFLYGRAAKNFELYLEYNLLPHLFKSYSSDFSERLIDNSFLLQFMRNIVKTLDLELVEFGVSVYDFNKLIALLIFPNIMIQVESWEYDFETSASLSVTSLGLVKGSEKVLDHLSALRLSYDRYLTDFRAKLRDPSVLYSYNSSSSGSSSRHASVGSGTTLDGDSCRARY